MRKILFQALVNGKLTEPYEVGSELSELHGQGCRMNIGLNDKTGKEIYSGDITNYGIVEWCECLNWDGGGSLHPGFYFKDKYECERGELSYHSGFDDDIEIIGNIYE